MMTVIHALSTHATMNSRRFGCMLMLAFFIFVLTQHQVQAAPLAQQENTPLLVPTRLITPTAAQESPSFGNALVTVDDWLVVGAPTWDGAQGDDQGAVYLFNRNQGGGEQWGQVARLTAPDAVAGDHFGAAVAITSDWLAVGAPQATVNGQTTQGAVYLFARNQADPLQWMFQQKVSATAGTAGEGFGGALALTPNRLAIGSTGKAYLFGPDAHTPPQWTQIKRLVPAAPPPTNFGAAVAVQDEFVLVGAPNADTSRVGAAYLFRQNQGGANAWGEVKQFTPPNEPPYISFGSAVLLVGDQAFIGAPYPSAVHIYGRQQGGADAWGEAQVLYPDLPITYASREFGRTLAVSESRLLVGAYVEVYGFEANTAQLGLWQAVHKLVLNDDGEFSPGVAAVDRTAFVGANEFWRSGVYQFNLTQAAAPTIGFTTATYTAREGTGAAVIEVALDRPNPYPSISIAYATANLGLGEATSGEDYTPITGTLIMPQNALTGTFTIPLTNDALLEPPEKISLQLDQAVNAVPGLLYATLQINDDDDAVCDFVATDEASLDRAIRCLYKATASGQTIQVMADITLSRPLPLIISPTVDEVSIEGHGHTIDAAGHGRVLTLAQIKATVRNLTLRGGRLPLVTDWPNSNDGGGIYATAPWNGFAIAPSCALSLTNVIVTDNEAYAGGGLYYGCEQPLYITNSTFSNNRAVMGGAFSTSGGEEFSTELFINRSTFSGNLAQQNGGAFDLSSGDGGVFLELVNSTVSSNRVISGTGGGLWITQSSHDGRSETRLINSTVADNEANQGSGVYNRYGTLHMSNSLIADNTGGSNCILFLSDDGFGELISHGYNLDSDGSCLPATVRQPTDLSGGNANLGPLADNGGATFTHALLTGSAALDAANNVVCLAAPVNGLDQRGNPRTQGRRCDIGAYEADAAAVTNAVFAWGKPDDGQLNVPAGLHGVIALAGGDGHSLALKADGAVVAWGRNQEGQTNVPAGLTDVTAIAAGYHHNLAVKRDGTVVAWGWNGYGQTDVPADLREVIAVAGGYHSLALKSNGLLVAWGLNNEGQATIPSDVYGMTAIAAGVEHSLALKRDGTVVAWGYNGNGEATVPADLHDVVAIAAGWFHSLALKRDGTVVAWGANDFGQATVPAGLTDVVAIAGGGYHSLALQRDGTIVAWGSNEFGQTAIPASVQGATIIAAGGWHSLAVAPAVTNANLLFVSSHSSGKAGTIQFRDEDIVAYDLTSNTWQMVFDGSNVGVTKDVDAFAFRLDGTLLLSFNAPTDVPGLGQVDDSDIVQFTPTTLGSATTGSFLLYLSGADVGLTTGGEDIDAIGFTADGRLVVSTIGDFTVTNLTGKDEDLLRLDTPSTGTWSLFLDGSAVGLANEDVNGLWIDPTNVARYLTVKDSFAFTTAQGGEVAIDANDIFVCKPTTDGGCTYERFWDSDEHAYGAKNLDAIGLGPLPPTFVPSVQASDAASPTPDELANDDDSDDFNLEELTNQLFLPWVGKGE